VGLFYNAPEPTLDGNTITILISAGPFVHSLFLFVKIDLATDSGSEYDRDKKKIGFHFFLHV